MNAQRTILKKPEVKVGCLVCKRDMSNNYGGFNGYCSDCLLELTYNKDVYECLRCHYTWKFCGKWRYAVRCPKCHNGYRTLEHQREYYYSQRRQMYLYAYRRTAEYKAFQKAYRLRKIGTKGTKNDMKTTFTSPPSLKPNFTQGEWRNMTQYDRLNSLGEVYSTYPVRMSNYLG